MDIFRLTFATRSIMFTTHTSETPEARRFQDQPHYVFKNLRRMEKFVISSVYFRTWRKLVNSKKLGKNERQYFELYFKEIHARYYKRVASSPQFVKVSVLTLNFLLSRANENLRAALLSLNPYNLTVFVHAVRSQIELNAVLQKFVKDADYHQKHTGLNEDRARVKEVPTVANVSGLVEKLDDRVLPYKKIYNDLSLLLHPNPSCVKFYAQAEADASNDGSRLLRPKIKFYFNETVTATKEYDSWFNNYLWFFLTSVEHFLLLLDSLQNDFFFSDEEQQQYESFAFAHFIAAHEREILNAVNQTEAHGASQSEHIEQKLSEFFRKKFGDKR